MALNDIRRKAVAGLGRQRSKEGRSFLKKEPKKLLFFVLLAMASQVRLKRIESFCFFFFRKRRSSFPL
jgi:hypothetical protein